MIKDRMREILVKLLNENDIYLPHDAEEAYSHNIPIENALVETFRLLQDSADNSRMGYVPIGVVLKIVDETKKKYDTYSMDAHESHRSPDSPIDWTDAEAKFRSGITAIHVCGDIKDHLKQFINLESIATQSKQSSKETE